MAQQPTRTESSHSGRAKPVPHPTTQTTLSDPLVANPKRLAEAMEKFYNLPQRWANLSKRLVNPNHVLKLKTIITTAALHDRIFLFSADVQPTTRIPTEAIKRVLTVQNALLQRMGFVCTDPKIGRFRYMGRAVTFANKRTLPNSVRKPKPDPPRYCAILLRVFDTFLALGAIDWAKGLYNVIRDMSYRRHFSASQRKYGQLLRSSMQELFKRYKKPEIPALFLDQPEFKTTDSALSLSAVVPDRMMNPSDQVSLVFSCKDGLLCELSPEQGWICPIGHCDTLITPTKTEFKELENLGILLNS